MPPSILTHELEKDIQGMEERKKRFERELQIGSYKPEFCRRMTHFLEHLQDDAAEAELRFNRYVSQDWQSEDGDLKSKISSIMSFCETHLLALEQRQTVPSPENAPTQATQLTTQPAT